MKKTKVQAVIDEIGVVTELYIRKSLQKAMQDCLLCCGR